MANTEASASPEDILLFQELEKFPWDRDEEFQAGLQAILGPDPAPEQRDHLTLRARCFYYARQVDYSSAWDSQAHTE